MLFYRPWNGFAFHLSRCADCGIHTDLGCLVYNPAPIPSASATWNRISVHLADTIAILTVRLPLLSQKCMPSTLFLFNGSPSRATPSRPLHLSIRNTKLPVLAYAHRSSIYSLPRATNASTHGLSRNGFHRVRVPPFDLAPSDLDTTPYYLPSSVPSSPLSFNIMTTPPLNYIPVFPHCIPPSIAAHPVRLSRSLL